MMSIRRQLTLQLLVVTAALSLVGGMGIYMYVRHALRRQFDQALEAKALALSRLVAWDETGKLILEIPQGALEEFRRSERPEYFEVWWPDGKVFARSDSLHGTNLPANGGERIGELMLPDGRAGRAVRFPFAAHEEADEPHEPGEAIVPVKPHEAGKVTLVIASDEAELDGALSHLTEGLVVVGGAMALVCIGVMVVTVKRGLKPLKRLSEEVEQFHSGSLDSRLSEEGLPGELRPIVQRLNELLGRIEGAFERERRFTSDAAHELRTPLAELRALSEVVMKWPRERGDATKEFAEVEAIGRQMERLVESLLAMARCSTGQREVEMREEEVGPILRESWKGCEARARDRGLKVIWRVEDGLRVATDRSLLMPLLWNVFSNAAEYAPADGEIECVAERGENGVEVRVMNAAPGIDRSDLAHLFEPFWRKDGARSGTEHSGLGLAVAAEYAQLLGLRLRAELAAPNHFAMKIWFPSSSAAPANERMAAGSEA